MKIVREKKVRGPRRGLWITLAVVLVLLLVLGLGSAFFTDWMWFGEMGYVSVFFKQLFTQLEIGAPLFVALFLLIDFYLSRLKKKYFARISSSEDTDPKRLTRYTRIVSAVFAFLIGAFAANRLWFSLLRFIHSENTGIKDPLFHLDVSFYLFRLDFLKQLNAFFIMVVLLFIVMTVIYYLILLAVHTPTLFERDYTRNGEDAGVFDRIRRGLDKGDTSQAARLDRDNLVQLGSIASGQLTVLGVILFVMLAIAFFLRQFDLLHAHTGVVYGAGFTDVNVHLWIYRILTVLSILGAVTVIHRIHRREWKKLAVIPAVMVGVFVVGNLGALAVQNLVVSPDELNKESRYLKYNIQFTRYAYDLNNIKVESYPAVNDLDASDLKRNEQTISNIRINDYDPVKDFYNQTQSIRQYYTFNDVDVDRYMVNGKLTQTYLSPREIDESKISETWLNQHLKYTHGYGLALSQVNAVTASGQPDILVKDIPPVSSVPDIQVTQPRIYFGESTNDYALVNTKEDEFDYPDGSENKYTTYKGKAGIRLNPFVRMLFAVRMRSLKLLVSSNLTSSSRILIYRNIESRVRRIMPYLKYESDPYAVVANGKLYWMIDAYTASSTYPYSRPYNDEVGTSNYIRNSVKVVVDAYNGDVSYYVVDPDEPIARVYQKIYPKLFRPFSEMPKALQAHIRYPDEMFKIQAQIYSRYHMSNVKVFYQDEDRWSIANQIYGTKSVQMSPNYFIVRLPGEKEAEFISMLPFTPRSKQNMSALMVARNDGKEYGKLIVYQMPKSKTVYGPMQIEAQIDQNTKISQDFSLWSSSGSSYRRGTMFCIPIENSVLYVEPVYLEASNQAIPEVKRVIVYYNDQIAYEATLQDALRSLFGGGGGAATGDGKTGKSDASGGTGSKSQEAYIQDAQEAYEKAQDALKEGDWTQYGRYMDQLETALNKLK